MYIAYSALRKTKGANNLQNQQYQQRLDAYNAACEKHRQQIAAIQKYLPGWLPPFEVTR